MDSALGQRLIDLCARIVAHFEAGHWEELGRLTGQSKWIEGHPRLLRSPSWGDGDYAGNVLVVLRQMVEADPRTLPIIESYLDRNFPWEDTYISAKPSERKVTFAPNVFQLPDGFVELDLVSVMMPFSAEFNLVHEAIGRACKTNAMRCLRADNIWEESTIIQDIFNLVFRAQVVVVECFVLVQYAPPRDEPSGHSLDANRLVARSSHWPGCRSSWRRFVPSSPGLETSAPIPDATIRLSKTRHFS